MGFWGCIFTYDKATNYFIINNFINMKKILVPTDFSSVANNALNVAVTIARQNNATIELLNVKEYPVGDVGAYYSLYGASGVSIDNAWDSVLKDAKQEMDELIAQYEGVNIQGLIEESSDDFVESMLHHNADLIVIGSAGAEGLKEFFGGSNSEEVVRLAKCPVLVVKENTHELALKKVVFAIDFTHQEFIKKAIANLPLANTQCYFLYIDTDLQAINYADTKARMKQLAVELGIDNVVVDIYESPTIEEGILGYVDFVKADLVVMYTHGRTGLSHFFRGSVAEDVVNHADVPVFTFVEH